MAEEEKKEVEEKAEVVGEEHAAESRLIDPNQSRSCNQRNGNTYPGKVGKNRSAAPPEKRRQYHSDTSRKRHDQRRR